MTFDLLSTVVITASATVVIATFIALFGSSLTQRISIGAAMTLWFIGVVWLGAPGAISTPINADLLNNKAELDALLKNIPLGRLGSVEDVAALAAFLASDEAAYVTGSTYFVDGGLIRNYHEQ